MSLVTFIRVFLNWIHFLSWLNTNILMYFQAKLTMQSFFKTHFCCFSTYVFIFGDDLHSPTLTPYSSAAGVQIRHHLIFTSLGHHSLSVIIVTYGSVSRGPIPWTGKLISSTPACSLSEFCGLLALSSQVVECMRVPQCHTCWCVHSAEVKSTHWEPQPELHSPSDVSVFLC